MCVLPTPRYSVHKEVTDRTTEVQSQDFSESNETQHLGYWRTTRLKNTTLRSLAGIADADNNTTMAQMGLSGAR